MLKPRLMPLLKPTPQLKPLSRLSTWDMVTIFFLFHLACLMHPMPMVLLPTLQLMDILTWVRDC